MIQSGTARLGADAELRFTPAGDPVASMRLAYNYGKRSAEGKRPTQWIEASLWGERAQKLIEYLKKGKEFFFALDELHIEEFERTDKTKGHKMVARVLAIEFVGSAGAGTEQPGSPGNTRSQGTAPAPTSGQSFGDFEDDIPF